MDLRQLDAGMEPGPVGAEQDLVRAGAAQCLPDGVGID